MRNLTIVGIMVDKRTDAAPKVQEILTRYGDNIIGRFGLHDPEEEQNGLITLNERGEQDLIDKLLGELSSLEGVKVKSMEMK